MPSYKYNVTMTCGGCSKAVDKALSRVEGLNKVDISLENQTVIVDTDSVPEETIFGAIEKTGKAVTRA
ncbi:copper chaperone-like protein [Conidiobolus coronatus NRRL 28638]|uniref:Copper chaperone-like protein n=1 Tax=Conidiobolus coronatus (strain ATCC 28846 / CBS 209.66 / NRRL 28638) TaxID=796925 RepID=A0A137NW80_CONC2|nr:copper chaperone-like protein [Conidiobolus coronatus NRRL 28638]|eukprot:KXN67080.1 copper chaperone-like protein [Conidiobolus coronatus NRRL 28638]